MRMHVLACFALLAMASSASAWASLLDDVSLDSCEGEGGLAEEGEAAGGQEQVPF